MNDKHEKENLIPDENGDLILRSFYLELQKKIKEKKIVVLNSDHGLIDVIDIDQIYDDTVIMLRTKV